MQVEHITRIGFPSRGPPQQKGYFPVGYCLLGKIVINDQCRPPCVPEIFTDGTACKRSIKLLGCRIRCGCGYDDRIIHGSCLFQGFLHVGNGRSFLSRCHIDAIHGLPLLIKLLLVDNGINSDGGFSRLPVPNDQFALSAADWNHGINGFDPGLQGFIHRLPEYHPGGLPLQGQVNQFPGDRPFSVNGFSQGIDHTSQQALAHSDGSDLF